MKKFLALLICSALVLSTLSFAACGSVFDGNYKEANAQTVEEFIEQVPAESDDKVFQSKGLEFSLSVKADGDSGNMEMSVGFKYVTDEEGNQTMSAKTVMKGSGQSSGIGASADIQSEAWYKDGYVYTKTMLGKDEIKAKSKNNFSNFTEELLNDNGYGEPVQMDVEELYSIIAEYENNVENGKVKFYLDNGENSKKLKIELNGAVMGENTTANGFYVFVYDGQFNLTAFKAELTITSDDLGTNVKTELKCALQPFSGNIALPSDLDTYKEGLFNI